jgi:alpha-galactosidase
MLAALAVAFCLSIASVEATVASRTSARTSQQDPARDAFDFTQRPANAMVLVGSDGHSMVPEKDGASKWTFEAGVLTASPLWDNVLTADAYADMRLHVEFRVNVSDAVERESRGNSGIYIQQRYEVQILDSFGVSDADYEAWDCGSLYRLAKPMENACWPAGTWQSFDIVFRAARFDGERKIANARISVIQNGRLIHDDYELPRKTGAGQQEGPDALALKLQGHHNTVAFRNVWLEPRSFDVMPVLPANDVRRLRKALARAGKTLVVAGRHAFVMEPDGASRGPRPWVFYAPTLPRLPGPEENWMFDRFLAAGVAVAGIDVGESYGSPDGTRLMQDLYEHLTRVRGFARRPALLARSRGGLMLYAWATTHPTQVAGIAGVYPVCDLSSYPGLARAAPAYGLTPAQLEVELARFNPISRLAGLAAARVPLHHIHGDADRTVPLGPNSRALIDRYTALGGPASLEVVPGGGHDMNDGWFQSRALTDFVIARALAGAAPADAPVQVYILAGQSNMVGIGQVNGAGTRWGDEMQDLVVSVYAGAYDPDADYDARPPVATQSLAAFGGVNPTPFPEGGTRVVRGNVVVRESGEYLFRPGYGDSTQNIMHVGGIEVHRHLPGENARYTPVRLEAGVALPFRIVYLTAAADGLGWIERADVPGTLSTVVQREGRHRHLLAADGTWRKRDDVWYRGVITATANQPLSVGCGANASSIGPELGFGHVVGDHHEAPVLLLKTSQGNRSLGWDFLPPGSERFEHEGRTYAGYGDRIPSWTATDPGKEVDWYAGKQYDDCMREAKAVLARFDDEFPQWAGRGYEIAGFVWWQGHKDGGSAAHAARYEHNLVRLIESLRSDFSAPNAPFVLGTIGFGGFAMSGHQKTVAEAQLAVSGETGRHPQFAGNVKTVETRGFWREAAASPRNQDFHYHGNAETYLEVGAALGRAMVELREARR